MKVIRPQFLSHCDTHNVFPILRKTDPLRLIRETRHPRRPQPHGSLTGTRKTLTESQTFVQFHQITQLAYPKSFPEIQTYDSLPGPVSSEKKPTRHYRRSHFVAKLPLHHLFSPSHAWVEYDDSQGICRIGLTRFATRMLGDMVDFGFEKKEGDPVKSGQILGWVEGFKAISDVYCTADGTFLRYNPELDKNIEAIDKDCHFTGWLYEVKGTPDPQCMEVEEYVAVLDKTIDKILENEAKE